MNGKRPATLAALVTAATLVPLALFGGVGFAKTLASASQYEYGPSGHQYGKVTICHHAGKHGKRVTITVSANALKAHKKHGDELGPCPQQAPKAPTTTSGDDSHGNSGNHGNSGGDHGNGKGNGNNGKGHGK